MGSTRFSGLLLVEWGRMDEEEEEEESIIQGWERMLLISILVSWSTVRQDLIRSTQLEEISFLQVRSAAQISSSLSKGTSPQTMSYRRIPRDQTVAGP